MPAAAKAAAAAPWLLSRVTGQPGRKRELQSPLAAGQEPKVKMQSSCHAPAVGSGRILRPCQLPAAPALAVSSLALDSSPQSLPLLTWLPGWPSLISQGH